MSMIPLDDVIAAFSTHGQADARYEPLRDLIPLEQWPVPLYPSHIIYNARITRAEQKGGLDLEAINPHELIQEYPAEVVAELREFCYREAVKDQRFTRMFGQVFYPYEEGSIKAIAGSIRSDIRPTSKRGAHEVTVAQLATLAWIMGIEGGENDDEQAASVLSALGLPEIVWSTGGELNVTAPRL